MDVLHPTDRKVRDGWGTRLVVAGRNEIKTEADPLRDDNRKVCDGWPPGRAGPTADSEAAGKLSGLGRAIDTIVQ